VRQFARQERTRRQQKRRQQLQQQQLNMLVAPVLKINGRSFTDGGANEVAVAAV